MAQVPKAPRPVDAKADAKLPGNDRVTDVLIVVSFLACMYLPTRTFFAGGMAHPADLRRDLSGRVIVITGANQGIGFEAAQVSGDVGGGVLWACVCGIASASHDGRCHCCAVWGV